MSEPAAPGGPAHPLDLVPNVNDPDSAPFQAVIDAADELARQMIPPASPTSWTYFAVAAAAPGTAALVLRRLAEQLPDVTPDQAAWLRSSADVLADPTIWDEREGQATA